MTALAAPDGKPPYRVPTVAETRAAPRNGFRVVSTFSGAGGSCYGFRLAGFDVVYASEFVAAARETYLANWPDAFVDDRDIRTVMAGDILARTGLEPGELDVLEGSPPCASFSIAGKREKAWGHVKKYSDTEQRTDDLFPEWIRLLEGLQPKVAVAENVAGMATGTAVGYLNETLRGIAAAGYRVRARILDASWLGVPQERRRVIIVAVRQDLDREPVHPTPLPYRYSIRDALPWLESVSARTGPQFTRAEHPVNEPSGTVGAVDAVQRWEVMPRVEFDNGGSRHDSRRLHPLSGPVGPVTISGHAAGRHWKVYGDGVSVADGTTREFMAADDEAISIEGYAIEGDWRAMAPGEKSSRYLNLVRPHPDRPIPTVTAMGGVGPGAASVTHPLQPRKFTMLELRRLCGFPDDYALTGSYSQQWERLGRAVPPPMMAAVAAAIRDRVLR